MTRSAVGAELAAVDIVIPVAIDTLFGRIEKRVRLMATLALHLTMRSEQRKARQVVVEAYAPRPCQFAVAGSTIFAHLHLMRIINGVTTDTRCFWPGISYRSEMTSVAVKLCMDSVQGEAGIPCVTEAHIHPLRLTMARLACGSVAFFVSIIVEMTTDTLP